MNPSVSLQLTLRVLIVEDRESDLELMVSELRRAEIRVDVRKAQTEREFREQVSLGADVILSDYNLPSFSALAVMTILHQMGSDIPVIIVTGSISEEVAVECMKQGAADYLLKDRLTRLGTAVKQAMAAKRGRDEKRRAERTRDAAMSELDHRVRNNLASVLALLDMSGRMNPLNERFASIFRGRIESLAVAHDALRDQQWVGADLSLLITRNLSKIQDRVGGKLTMEGLPVQLPSRAVNSVSLAIHELAANAAAFGAWSQAGGLVEVTWNLQLEDTIRLTWQERDGPKVNAPTRRGIGLHLIENLVAHEAGGNVQMTFAPAGVRAVFTLPKHDLFKEIP